MNDTDKSNEQGYVTIGCDRCGDGAACHEIGALYWCSECVDRVFEYGDPVSIEDARTYGDA